MRLYYSNSQLEHAPRQFMSAGRIVAPFEVPERAQRMAAGLTRLGLTATEPMDLGLAPIHKVHDAHYVSFLTTAHERFSGLPNAGPEALPNVHPYVGAYADLSARERPRPTSIVGLTGWYVGDMACAIGAGTWTATYASAQAAASAAMDVVGGAGEAMALCRPPGHHAYPDRASGFCFLNNAAIAAEVLLERFDRVGIIDFDTHHGDGTQAIFYRRCDVFYASTHTSPRDYYPFFFGYADEAGFGEGDKFNLNVPLDFETDDETFIDANQRLIVAVLAAEVDALVLSAGWDAHRDDPLSRLAITSNAFRRLGRIYGEVPLPTVIIQEGGYSLAAIEHVAPLFVTEFLDERKPEL
ncbi:MAG: histone deacetylase family protein [Hyphomicrobiaceae bacterium]